MDATRRGCWVVVSVAMLAHALLACPAGCQCAQKDNRKTTMCMDTGFLDVPHDIPSDTVELYLKGNRINHLRHSVFAALESLQILIITDSMVEEIEPNAFSGLPNLSYLDLQKNKIRSLQSYAFSGLVKLQRLVLDYNDIVDIDNFAFHGLNLTRLRMEQVNRLQDISSKAFYSCSVNELHISNSTLSGRSMGAFLPLRSSLRELVLEHNHQELVIPQNLFQDFNFRRLELNYVGIRDTSFLEFVQTDELSLEGNPLGPVDFSRYPSLQRVHTLRLDKTNFANVEGSYFQGMTHLTHLYLSHNGIMTLPENLAPVFSDLKRLTLEGNYFYCTCELIWFKRWMTTAKTMVIGATCSLPYEDDLIFVDQDNMKCSPPSVVAISPALKVASGGQLTLTCTAQGVPPPTITWLLPDGGVTSAAPSSDRNTTRNTGTFHVRAVGMNNQGLYRCVARNPAGNVSDTVDVGVYTVAGQSQQAGGATGTAASVSSTPFCRAMVLAVIIGSILLVVAS